MISARLSTAVALMVVAMMSDAEAQTAIITSVGGVTHGVAESQVVENGVVKGECAYIDNEGNQIKIRYSGDTITETEPADLVNAADHLLTCRKAAERLAATVIRNNKKIAEDIRRQQQEISDQILGQQLALQQQLQEQQKQIFNSLPQFGNNFPFGGLFQNREPNLQFAFRR